MPQILDELVGPALRGHFAYRHFADPRTCKVLFVRPPYYLADEIDGALTALGHHVETVPFRTGAAHGAFVQELLMRAALTKPDFVLAVNHFGFDEEAQLSGLLERLELPVAVWYVDDPVPILRGAEGLCTERTALFLWERRWVEHFGGAGRGTAHWLPLALDPRRMAPFDRAAASAGVPSREVVFVGSSWTGQVEKAARRLPEDVRSACGPAVRALARDGRLAPGGVLACAGLERADARVQADAVGYVQKVASSAYRQAVLDAFPPDLLRVVGDPVWRLLLPRVECRPATDYQRETASVYARAGVVLNVTSRQMPSAVNQRAFDVPGAGGFVLGDRQDDLEELFPPGAAVTYGDPGEAVEKARWYLDHPAARADVVAAAREEIAARHLYPHRLGALVEAMRSRFAD